MNGFKYIKNILILFLLFNSACTNTRMIVEGTKKIINKTSKEEIESTKKENFFKGHYKVGNPYNPFLKMVLIKLFGQTIATCLYMH